MYIVVGKINNETIAIEQLEHLFIGASKQLDGVLYRIYIHKYKQKVSIIDTIKLKEMMEYDHGRLQTSFLYNHMLIALKEEIYIIRKQKINNFISS